MDHHPEQRRHHPQAASLSHVPAEPDDAQSVTYALDNGHTLVDTATSTSTSEPSAGMRVFQALRETEHLAPVLRTRHRRRRTPSSAWARTILHLMILHQPAGDTVVDTAPYSRTRRQDSKDRPVELRCRPDERIPRRSARSSSLSIRRGHPYPAGRTQGAPGSEHNIALQAAAPAGRTATTDHAEPSSRASLRSTQVSPRVPLRWHTSRDTS